MKKFRTTTFLFSKLKKLKLPAGKDHSFPLLKTLMPERTNLPSVTVFLLMILLISSINAQEKSKTQKIESPQVVEGEVTFSDGTNQLLKITDEGTFGAIQLKNGTPSNTNQKIYSVSNKLYFNGALVGGGDNDWTINGNDMYSNAAGNVGVNNPAPAFTLDVGGDFNFAGRLYINGQPGTPGQVLTSGGPNNPPTWESPETTTGFSSYLNQNLDLTGGTNLLTNTTEIYDHGNTYDPATWVFTAPSDGIYHFDYKLAFAPTTNPLNGEITAAIFQVNGVTPFGGKFVKRIWTNSTAGESVMFSINLELTKADEVTFLFSYPSGLGIRVASATNTSNGEATMVSGFKVN